MDDFELELKLDFLNESVDLLENAENAFLRLESERENSELINEIFRLAHNLKGTSKAVGFDQLSELTHVAENLILKIKEGTFKVTDSAVSVLLEFKDKIHEMIEGLKEDINASFEINSLKQRLEDITNGGSEKIPVMLENEDHKVEKIPDSSQFKEEELIGDIEISEAALESLKESGFSQDIIDGLQKENTNTKTPTPIPVTESDDVLVSELAHAATKQASTKKIAGGGNP